MIYLRSPGDVEITVHVNEHVLFAKLNQGLGRKKNVICLFVRESNNVQ